MLWDKPPQYAVAYKNKYLFLLLRVLWIRITFALICRSIRLVYKVKFGSESSTYFSLFFDLEDTWDIFLWVIAGDQESSQASAV